MSLTLRESKETGVSGLQDVQERETLKLKWKLALAVLRDIRGKQTELHKPPPLLLPSNGNYLAKSPKWSDCLGQKSIAIQWKVLSTFIC